MDMKIQTDFSNILVFQSKGFLMLKNDLHVQKTQGEKSPRDG